MADDFDISDELADNYRAVIAERGGAYGWPHLADQLERVGDARTAAWARAQAEPKAPKGRKAAASAEQVDA